MGVLRKEISVHHTTYGKVFDYNNTVAMTVRCWNFQYIRIKRGSVYQSTQFIFGSVLSSRLLSTYLKLRIK